VGTAPLLPGSAVRKDLGPSGLRKRLSLLLALLLALAGCAPPYLIHLGIGQGRIMLARRHYPDALRDPDLGARDKSLILIVQEAKRFGEETIGLARTDNFSSYVKLDRETVSWNVTAAEKTRLDPHRWWFPIVGHVPYKGYFSQERARSEARQLDEKGYDTHVGRVAAYSTLGYFADPIFSTFLRYPESALPELILHELTHSTLFIKGEVDFNEGFATFVGHKGGLAFLEQRYGEGSRALHEARERFRDELAFGAFVAQLCKKLQTLYDQDLPEDLTLAQRETIFEKEKQVFAELERSFSIRRYHAFAGADWNNAVILAHRRYYRDLPAFEKLYESMGEDLREVVSFFQEAKARGENPREALLRATGEAAKGDRRTVEGP
jgi:predicted aminopeptidase